MSIVFGKAVPEAIKVRQCTRLLQLRATRSYTTKVDNLSVQFLDDEFDIRCQFTDNERMMDFLDLLPVPAIMPAIMHGVGTA